MGRRWSGGWTREAAVLCMVVWSSSFSLSNQQGSKGKFYKGYDGFWIWDEEKLTVHGGPGYIDVGVDRDVVSKLGGGMSPCKFDGRICTTSKAVLSNPGEFVHHTGRTYCTERVTVPSCDARMRARGFGQLLDELRPKPYELYPQVDGHTTSTFVSGVNFNGELGLGLRRAVHEPTIQTYFKIGDGLFAQEMGSGRGFKNVSIINFGFSHGFALDTQGVLYAWGSNSFGQLGIRNRANRDGHRFHQPWPYPLLFFRPMRVPVCEGGLSDLLLCKGPADRSTCFPASASSCRLGRNQVARRRNAFAASKLPSQAGHSAVVTDFYPEGCFSFYEFLDEDVLLNGYTRKNRLSHVGGVDKKVWEEMLARPACTDGGKLYTWGYNVKGQLGLGSSVTYEQLPREVRVPDDAADRWYSVALGGQHTVASTIKGAVYTWGLNDEGQLGLDDKAMDARCLGPIAGAPPPAPPGPCCHGICNLPQRIRGTCSSRDDCLDGVKIVHVSAGLSFTVLLDVQGNVWSFGSNTFGQLCQGKRVGTLGARPLANFNDYRSLLEEGKYPGKAALPPDVRIADVVAGWYHVLAVTTEGFLLAWGRNDRGQLGREHTEHDSCHLELRTDLPDTLDVRCKRARVNGSSALPRLNLCITRTQESTSQLVPGNTTSAAAGELHSAVLSRANWTWRNPVRGKEAPYEMEAPFKYRGSPLDFPPAESYEPSKMWLDCDGEYNEVCREQGLLLRYPNKLAHVYMFGDNRFGQLGISETRAYYSSPQLVTPFLAFDWGGVAAGSRQTFWISRANSCSGNCNGHGICNHDTGRCTCEEPWSYELDCLTAWCPNNCSGNGLCFPQLDVGDTGINLPLQGNGPECACHYPFWDVDCSRAVCPNNCWGPDHGICNSTDGSCTCVGNASVTYTGFDCYVPDPLHVLDPLRFYVQQLLRISPFFVNGSAANLSAAQEEVLTLVAKYGSANDAAMSKANEKRKELEAERLKQEALAESQPGRGASRRGSGLLVLVYALLVYAPLSYY